MNPYPFARYPPYSYDDTWIRQPAVFSPSGSPLRGTRPLSYEDDYWTSPRYGPAWPGMHPAYAPFPPSPTFLATMVPLPPSPHVSPRLGPVALGHAGLGGPQYLLPVDPTMYYVPTTPPANPWHQPRSQLHPYINGESGRLDIVLDLSASTFRPLSPVRVTGPNNHSSLSAVHPGHLSQTASYPATTRMNITCAALSPYAPDWVIRIDLGRQISVGDVLRGIHDSLQTKISHLEWARLPESATFEISRAYTRRCRSADSFSNAADFERNQGVRRVDFLGERYLFGGLMRAKQDDMVNFRLVVKGR